MEIIFDVPFGLSINNIISLLMISQVCFSPQPRAVKNVHNTVGTNPSGTGTSWARTPSCSETHRFATSQRITTDAASGQPVANLTNFTADAAAGFHGLVQMETPMIQVNCTSTAPGTKASAPGSSSVPSCGIFFDGLILYGRCSSCGRESSPR